MGTRVVEDLIGFQLAVEFKREVYRLVNSCRARIDLRYKSQLFDAASAVEADLAEGFRRNVPGEFAQFIRYALASLAEAQRRLRDGIDRGHFEETDCRAALALGKRCADVTQALLKSLAPFLRHPGRRLRR